MLERASARLWVSIVAGAIAFPVAAIVLLAVWLIRFQIVTPPTPTNPSPVTVAAASPNSLVRQKVDAAAPPQRAAAAELVARPTTEPSQEPTSAAPIPDNASPAQAALPQLALPQAVAPQPAPQDPPSQAAVPQEAPPQDASPSVSRIVTAKPAVPEPAVPQSAALEPARQDTGAVSPMPTQVEAAKSLPAEEVAKTLPPDTVGERFAPALDAKAPDFTPALSVFATLAVAPPKLGTAYADPNQDGSISKPATPKLSEPISGPVPLPRPKPRLAGNLPVAPVSATNSSRVPPSSLPRPVGSNSPPRTAPATR